MADKITKVTSDCIHHWIINSPSGGDRKGKCKKCNLIRDFSNSGWDNTKTIWGHETKKQT